MNVKELKNIRYMDASLSAEERADDLLSRMSLEQKFAQLQCEYLYEIKRNTYDGIGEIGTLFFEAETAEEWAKEIEETQRQIIETSEYGIPALIHCEALTGAVMPESTVFQSGIGQGATWDPQSVRDMADIARKQLLAVGIRQALAPVMDICREPRWGRLGETYGEDPTLGAAMSVAYVKGMQSDDLKNGVIATSKHFLAYGASEGGINMANTPVTERTLREVYAKPFQAAITEAGLQSVMNSYGTINGEPVVVSKKYLHQLLREEMGFEGLVVSDYTSLGYLQFRFHMAETMGEAGEMALKAGLDVECPQPLGYNQELLENVRAGKVDESYVDRACRRVLVSKFKLGLFENPYPDKEAIKREFYNAQYDKICLQNARKSLVLLKNNGILPLSKKTKKIAVIGPHVDCLRQLFGCYTWQAITEMYADFSQGAMAGTDTAKAAATAASDGEREYLPGSKLKKELSSVEPRLRESLPQCLTVLEAIKKTCPDSEIGFVKGYDYIGDDRTQLEDAIKAAKEADVVLASCGGKYGWGATVTTGECMDAANIGLLGIQEEALRLLAEANPNLVLLHFDGRPISSEYAEGHAAAILECWNPGMYGAEAIADVIFGDYNPGGKLPVTVSKDASQLPMYYNHENGSNYSRGAYLVDGYVDMDMRWKVEAGAMEVQIGSSSNEILLTAPFTITRDAYVEGRTRSFYAKAIM